MMMAQMVEKKVIVSQKKMVKKVILAGNGGIGKTSLMQTLCDYQFRQDNKLTVGADVFIIPYKVKGQLRFLQVWDLGGQDRFRFMLPDFKNGCVGMILGFDVSRRNSFIELKGWIELLRDNVDLPVVLIGTKIDLGYHPLVSPELAREFVQEKKLLDFFEISSKDKLNVHKPLNVLISRLENCEESDIEYVKTDNV
jgi:small GTP-binding protein